VSARLKHRQKRLPLPPYASQVIEIIRRDGYSNTYICADDRAWETQRIRRDRVVLPPGDDPALYDWSFLKNQSPIVYAADAEQGRIMRLLGLLLQAGTRSVGCYFVENGQPYLRHFRL
jgi:hypothetical protein